MEEDIYRGTILGKKGRRIFFEGFRFPGTTLTYIGEGLKNGKYRAVVCRCDCGVASEFSLYDIFPKDGKAVPRIDCCRECSKRRYESEHGHTFEEVLAVSDNYEYLCDFENNEPLLANYARKHHWTDLLGLKKKSVERSIWCDQSVLREEAKRFMRSSDFRSASPEAYAHARDKDLIKTFEWMEDDLLQGFNWRVYCYRFDASATAEGATPPTAYVGLTINPPRRNYGHMFGKSPVGDFSRKWFDGEFPEMEILEEGLDAESAKALEGACIDALAAMGYEMLNKAKAGGLGGIYQGPSYLECKAAAEKCKSRDEMFKRFHKEYSRSVSKGWLDDWLPRKKEKWTDEKILKIAVNYDSLCDFRKNEKKAWVAAKRRHMLKTFTWMYRKKRVAVDAFSKDGKFVMTFDSIASASKYVKRRSESIRDCLNGKQKSCGGLCWRRAER